MTAKQYDMMVEVTKRGKNASKSQSDIWPWWITLFRSPLTKQWVVRKLGGDKHAEACLSQARFKHHRGYTVNIKKSFEPHARATSE